MVKSIITTLFLLTLSSAVLASDDLANDRLGELDTPCDSGDGCQKCIDNANRAPKGAIAVANEEVEEESGSGGTQK